MLVVFENYRAVRRFIAADEKTMRGAPLRQFDFTANAAL
jgi:hypothetical protein